MWIYRILLLSLSVISINLLAPSIVCYNLDTEHAVVFDYPFRLDRSQQNQPNFGYSVLMNKEWANTGDSFLIGAPNANSSGLIFTCQWRSPSNRATCRSVDIQFGSNGPTDGMHLGSNLVQHPSISDQYLSCAYSRTFSYTLPQTRQHLINPTGACYLMQHDRLRPITEFLPLNVIDRQFGPNERYDFSHSMFGFATSFSKNGNQLLSGVPGFENWNGAMLGLSSNWNEHHFYKIETGRDHYMGYSIAVGNFFKNKRECAVLGIPRLNLIGSVAFCQISHEKTCRSFRAVKGSQIGEYFGSSVLAIDLNGDGLDDLLVGAPMFSSLKKGFSDEGRVLVYRSSGNDFVLQTILYGMQKSDARFGTSMANLGDVNGDGFNDIVISAPYEDSEQGTIYIYRGSLHGVQSNFSQRVSAADHLSSLNLLGFGFSFSGNIDIDNNNFKDLMVGAHLSNKAVLLRTRPIISLPVNIDISDKYVNLNEECTFLGPSDLNRFPYLPACVSLRYCFNTEDFPRALEATLSTSLWIDQLNNRCFVLAKGTNSSQSNLLVRFLEHKIIVRRQTEPICSEKFIVLFKESSKIQNLLDPIELRLSYHFSENDTKHGDIFHIPMIDNGKNNYTEDIYFKLCSKSAESSCLSELRLSPIVSVDNNEIEDISNIELIEGSYRNITLQVSVTNFADPAYGTKLNLTSNTNLSLINIDHKCHTVNDVQSTNRANILCALDSPLNAIDTIELVFNSFSTIGLIEFDLNTTIITNLDPESATNTKIVFNISKIASINLNSSDLWPRIPYQRNALKSDVYFSNTLQLQKLNYSSIDLVELIFIYPSSHNGQDLLTSAIQILNLDKSFSMNCHPEKDFNFEGLYSGTSGSSFQMISDYGKQKLLNLTCSNLKYICKMVKCDVGPLSITALSSFFKYSSSLNVTLVENKYRNYMFDQIGYHLKVMAKIVDSSLSSQTTWNDINFVFEPIQQIPVMPLPIWPIILGLILGLLFLILIILALIKCGFFKRSSPEPAENNNEETEALN